MAQAGSVYDSYHEYDHDLYMPQDRLYVRPNVSLPFSDVDPRTGMLRMDLQRQGRTQALRLEGNQLDNEYIQMDAAIKARAKEKGLRIPLRYTVIGFILLLLCLSVALLVQQGTLAQRRRMLNNVNQRIETLLAQNNELEQQIAIASDSATICYSAARNLGMVPAASTQAIHLTAMDTRPGETDSHATASANSQNREPSSATAGQ